MASVEGDEPNLLSEEFSFLDLQNCSPKTKSYLLSLIEDEEKPKKVPNNSVATTTTATVIEEAGRVTVPPPVTSALAHHQQVQQQQQHFTHHQQIYPTPPTSQPYVYINNVTANVNVHHGATSVGATGHAGAGGEQSQMKQVHMGQQAGHHPPGVSASGFPVGAPTSAHQTGGPHQNPIFAANPPGLIPPNAVPYIYPPQFAPMPTKGPPTPATVNAAPQPHYMPMFIHLPYALPVSSQQPHVPPPVSQQPPRAQQQLMRNSPPILPISTAAAAAVAPAAPIEAFYQQQPPMIVAQPQITPEPSSDLTSVHSPTPTTSVPGNNESVSANHITSSSNDVEKSNPQVEPNNVTDLEKNNSTEIVKTSSEKVDEKCTNEDDAKSKKDIVKTKDTSDHDDSDKQISSGGGGGGKSWASLFHKDPPSVNSANLGNKPMARIPPYSEQNETHKNADTKSGVKNELYLGGSGSHMKNHSNCNPHDLEMAKFLQNYVMTHRSSMIKPRGLSNRNNWCFVNAILQALVACPTFYNLVKALPEDSLKKASMVKFTKAIRGFVCEFSPLDHFPKINRRERDKGKKNEDLPVGMTFEASSIFQLLLSLNSDTFKVEEGRQEDAEEFLTFLLNELNDEMSALIKLLIIDEEPEDEQNNPDQNESHEDEEDTDEWHEVGAKNKSLLTRRVGGSNVSLKSPLGSIFQGQLQSCVQLSNGEPTATLQPFFTLPLDIQSKNIKNVSDALIHNFTSEALDGYVCSKTKKEIEASRSLYLDELPSVLILHLKRFIYDDSGSQKLLKNIDFPVDLEIPREILSSNSRNKYHPKQRSFKLFAVVYHNGKEATLGHYVTDVYHAGLGWLHCDDSLIKSMTEAMVMSHSANSVPYILFYRRGDTMGQGSNVSANTGGSKI